MIVECQCRACGHIWTENGAIGPCPKCGEYLSPNYDEGNEEHNLEQDG